MSYFYGVYLSNSEATTALDLLRFLAEPQDIRLSHITLRGPYPKKLSSKWLKEKNENPRHEWNVRLTGPDRFLSNDQCTVFIAADLLTLRSLWHKPDFPRGLPHLTVYDGKDRELADNLLGLLRTYQWDYRVPVTKLRLIQRKHGVDEVLLPSFVAFHGAFERFVGKAADIPLIRVLSAPERLAFAKGVLDAAFRPSLHPSKAKLFG